MGVGKTLTGAHLWAILNSTAIADWGLGEVGIQFDSALSATTKYSGIICTGTYGATLAFGDSVYMASSGKWLKTDADAEATAGGKLVGMALESGVDDDSNKKIMLIGFVKNTAWAWGTKGGELWLHTMAGELSQTKPSGSGDIVRAMGFVFDAVDTIIVWPSQDWVEIA